LRSFLITLFFHRFPAKNLDDEGLEDYELLAREEGEKLLYMWCNQIAHFLSKD